MSNKHAMTEAVRRCEAAGLVLETGKKHPKMVNPRTGRSVSFSSSPSDGNAHRQFLRDVKKYLGVDLT